jgi:hypothetical protein
MIAAFTVRSDPPQRRLVHVAPPTFGRILPEQPESDAGINMANLIKCESCAAQVSRDATACPKCGHPIKSRHTSWGAGKWIVAIIVGFFVLRVGLNIGQHINDDAVARGSPASGVPAVKPQHWTYDTTNDSLKSGAKDYSAQLQSINVFEFRWPYSGSQHATLTLRNSAQHGRDAYIEVQRGQFLCGLDPCLVQVVFDAGAPKSFQMLRPKDSSTTYLFFADQKKFVEGLQHAAKTKIQATFYQEGDQVMEFDVSGFDAGKLQR